MAIKTHQEAKYFFNYLFCAFDIFSIAIVPMTLWIVCLTMDLLRPKSLLLLKKELPFKK